jgi:hypothetical protein
METQTLQSWNLRPSSLTSREESCDAALELTPQDQGEDRTSRLGRLLGKVVLLQLRCRIPLSIELPGGTIYVSYNGGFETPLAKQVR